MPRLGRFSPKKESGGLVDLGAYVGGYGKPHPHRSSKSGPSILYRVPITRENIKEIGEVLSCQVDEGTGFAQTKHIEWNVYSKRRHFYIEILRNIRLSNMSSCLVLLLMTSENRIFPALSALHTLTALT
jgi:hypothetical protein